MTTFNQQNSSATAPNDVPPPYSPRAPLQHVHVNDAQPQNNDNSPQPKRRIDADVPWVKELSQPSSPRIYEPSHDRTFSADSLSSSGTKSKLKSRWHKLKAENKERKAKNQSITHEQAARMSGHDDLGFSTNGPSEGVGSREEWDYEREERRKTGVHEWNGTSMG